MIVGFLGPPMFTVYFKCMHPKSMNPYVYND